MEPIAYLISIAAGVFFSIAGCRLLRLSGRTRERPELLLGLYLTFSSQWYLLYNAPYFLGIEALPPLLGQGSEWIYILGTIPYLLFLRSTFRPESAWATALVIACALSLFAGAVVAILGDGISNSLDDPSYLPMWVGYSLPCYWMCCEGAISDAAAKKRVRIGLCDPIVSNRYLLFAGFGVCQIIGSAVELVWAYGNSAAGTALPLMDGLLGAAEIASVAVLWLAFFPPRVYRRWIDGHAAFLSTPTEEA
jgi:hypothetical protein